MDDLTEDKESAQIAIAMHVILHSIERIYELAGWLSETSPFKPLFMSVVEIN